VRQVREGTQRRGGEEGEAITPNPGREPEQENNANEQLMAAVKRRDEARRTWRELRQQTKAAKEEAAKAQDDLDDMLADQASGQQRMFGEQAT
jgi:hypothetical protein